MKRYLVTFLFILSLIANSNVLAGVLLTVSNMQEMTHRVTEPHTYPTQMPEISDHCHQMHVTQTFIDDACQANMGGVCDNCFTHCGGALLTVAFPHFIAQPTFLVATLPHYYTPLITSTFLRPPQVS